MADLVAIQESESEVTEELSDQTELHAENTKHLKQDTSSSVHKNENSLPDTAQTEQSNGDSGTEKHLPQLGKIVREKDRYAEADIQYVSPLDDPFAKAHKYLAKHMILGLFQQLTAGIAYNHPADPFEYMIEEIEAMQEADRLKKGVTDTTLTSQGVTDTTLTSQGVTDTILTSQGVTDTNLSSQGVADTTLASQTATHQGQS